MKKSKKNLTNLFYNLAALLILLAVFSLFSWGGFQMNEPLAEVKNAEISLDASNLPEYTIRTITRMFLATILALVFAISYGTFAAKNKRAEKIMIPLLDVLQSAPILGYISFALAGFILLFPNSSFGAEMAAIFAIFTSQAWNMTFSVYQSMSNVPKDFYEVSSVLKLSKWRRFWRLELPFAAPALIWNMMMSISGGWFFVVACEAITVGNQQFLLPGIGSYISVAIAHENVAAIFYAIATMAIVIFIYDRIFFRPLVVWSDKFRYDLNSSQYEGDSLVLKIFRRSAVIKIILKPLNYLANLFLKIDFSSIENQISRVFIPKKVIKNYSDYLWYGFLTLILLAAALIAYENFYGKISIIEIFSVLLLGIYTGLRVIILVVIASIIWVPIGIYIGLRPKLTAFMQPIVQFCAAFPANLLFPVMVIFISKYQLNPNIWLGVLMILGAQWYILFNVIAGASSFATDLRDVVKNYKLKGFTWWRKIMIPAIIPYFLTGVVTAAGGAWNASIVAEVVNWGSVELQAKGVGAYIVLMMREGDYSRITLGVMVMCLLVILMNRFVWNPLYKLAIKRFPVN